MIPRMKMFAAAALCLLAPADGRAQYTPGPPVAPTTASGATLVVYGGIAYLTGSNNGDDITVVDLPGVPTTQVQVTNSAGTDVFTFPSSCALEVVCGTGPNTVESFSLVTMIAIGGTGNNAMTGGPGFAFLVSIGGGSNTFQAGPGYTAFVCSAFGSTHCVGGGAYNSASFCQGTNTFDAASPAATYSYFGTNTVNADASDPLDVYEVGGSTQVNNPFNNPAVTVHNGLF